MDGTGQDMHNGDQHTLTTIQDCGTPMLRMGDEMSKNESFKEAEMAVVREYLDRTEAGTTTVNSH